jgi:trans-aconitate methyltransferase
MAKKIIGVHMSNGGSRVEHIEQVRSQENGATTASTNYVSTVVNEIDNYRVSYYTQVGSAHAEVETVHPTGLRPYIRTKADGTVNDNLLKLPRF